MTAYRSKPVDQQGYVDWSEEEAQTWSHLVSRQMAQLPQSACAAYLDGLRALAITADHVPQLPEINRVLHATTGWRCEPVPALIDFDRFFALLADKAFPVAIFLRTPAEMDYLQEPDYFHEIFGHCAMLTHPAFAHFTHTYGVMGKQATPAMRVYLARLYWFTVEFGLVYEDDALKIYGGGILSSSGETQYALHSEVALREPFSLLEVLRTPYRIDIMQPLYYCLLSLEQLYALSDAVILAQVERAMQLGLKAPLFPPKIASA
uniref:phenylalanine 4-monooxygenase n=1 Tax=Thaumasiovibrio occultus TaxID=1891184 RepID=UPI000B34E34E|nr:phenylalanine 4-monooxygenase [Thaumasiovibrio occultus]